MVNAFADLPKTERIKKAVAAYAVDYRLIARKAEKFIKSLIIQFYNI
jgi:hypothetical protein